jgi:drug/metabolite transporter (DMT)-like permease
MKLNLGAKSIALFMLSILFFVLLTVFESSLSGLSLTAERAISALLLVLPAVIGVVFGIRSITSKEPKPWVAILGVLLNALFALFFIFLLSFTG